MMFHYRYFFFSAKYKKNAKNILYQRVISHKKLHEINSF